MKLEYNQNQSIGITPFGYNPKYKLTITERKMKYQELEALVIAWGKQKGILDNGTTMKQAEKTHEEVLELISAIDEDNREEIIDALGDILVTIILQAEMQGLKLEECLQSAYDIISKRTGVMRDGQFHKD
jgi:uncharacterized protein YabN with tetrapyrrole methylase and pyrophosphatase domain